MSQLQDLWDNYYAENVLGMGSGEGSITSATVVYRNIIENFIRLNRPNRVLDLGCGDWQISRHIPWRDYDISYLGLDVSPLIISRNTASFSSASVEFKTIEGPSDLAGLGEFDLVISKDVLQHIPSATVNEYLDCFEAISRISLITNDVYPDDHINVDIEPLGWRAMDIRQPPFSRKSFVIAEYSNTWKASFWVKHVHLLPGKARP
jgi:SAM-dependent methyltransferase